MALKTAAAISGADACRAVHCSPLCGDCEHSLTMPPMDACVVCIVAAAKNVILMLPTAAPAHIWTRLWHAAVAASFVQAVNTGSLTMDPGSFHNPHGGCCSKMSSAPLAVFPKGAELPGSSALRQTCTLQSVAASFVETVNAGSLTMDPDEFMARMVAAGVPDMQLHEEASLGQKQSLHDRLSSQGDFLWFWVHDALRILWYW